MRDRTWTQLAGVVLAVLLLAGHAWGQLDLDQTPAVHDPFADRPVAPMPETSTPSSPDRTAESFARVVASLDRLLSWLDQVLGEAARSLPTTALTNRSPAGAVATVPAGQPGTVRVNSYLNFRVRPNGPVLSRLYHGDQVEILGREGAWYKIRVGTQIGYAYARYITVGAGPARSTNAAGRTAATTPAAPGVKGRTPDVGRHPPGQGAPMTMRTTGYYPPPPGGYKSKAEARLEGGAYDCRGKKLRTLQDYNPKDPNDYVSCATDPRVIKTGTFFTLDQFPGVRFLACDVGGAIKGNRLDICCKTKADTYRLPSQVTLRVIR